MPAKRRGARREDRGVPDLGQNVVVRHDDEITSDELDELLDEATTLSAKRPMEGTEVRLYVAVGADTLHHLEKRAIAEGRDVSVVAAAHSIRDGPCSPAQRTTKWRAVARELASTAPDVEDTELAFDSSTRHD